MPKEKKAKETEVEEEADESFDDVTDEDFEDRNASPETKSEKPSETAKKEVSNAPIPKVNQEIIERQAMEREMLNNNGIFRAELLYQLNEINKALVGIAEVLVDKRA